MKTKPILSFLTVLVTLLAAVNCWGAARVASVSGLWSSTATWGGLSVPVAADTVTINTGINVTGLGGNQACTTIQINGTGTLTVDSPNTLTVSGNVTVGSGGGTGATLTIASGGAMSITGTFGFNGTTPSIVNNGTFNCAGGGTFSTGTLNNNGTATFSGSAQAFNGSIAVVQGANATLNLTANNSTPFGGSSTLSASASGNTVSYTAGGQNMKGATYFNLSVSGNSPSAGSSTIVNGTLRLNLNSGQQVNSANNITMGPNSTIVRILGQLSGTPVFPAGPNYVSVIYANTTAMTTGTELPANIKNLTITNTPAASSANRVTLNTSTTVNGTLAVTYLTTPSTTTSSALLAASGKTVTFSSSPVSLNFLGTTLGSSATYPVVSGGSTFVSGTLGTLTVNGAGAPAGSTSVAISSGVLNLTVGAASPVITGAATTAAFTTTYGSASANQSFAVSGANLTANLVATAGTGFEVATTSGGSYGPTATYTQSGGNASGTVWVRLAATALVSGSYNSVNAVVLSSTGATSANITTPPSGNAVNPLALTFTGSKSYDGNASATAAELSFANNLDGGNLTKSGSVTLANSAVGSQSITSFGGLSLGGSAAGNYTLAGASGSVTINQSGTSVAVSSSANPSGYLENVMLIAAVTPSAATGTIQFKTNGVTFGGAITLAPDGIATNNTASLLRGTIAVTAEYSGEVNYSASTGTLSPNQVITNHPPVASNLTLGVAHGEMATLLVIGGKHAPTDVDGDSLEISAVGTASSGTPGFTPTNVTYTADGDQGTNTFTYTVSDGFGGSDTKTVTVLVYAAQGFNRLAPPDIIGPGEVALSYLGIPGENYALDHATNLTPPIVWSAVITNTAANNGYLNFTNSSAATENYFRTRHVVP